MNKIKETEWYQENHTSLYDYFHELSDEEKYNFLTHLLTEFPKLDIDWISLIMDIQEALIFQDRVDKVEKLVGLYAEVLPGKYSNEYEFIEKDLINYYLFKSDIDKALERLKFVKANPVGGIDTITISVMFQLIYHGCYDEAVSYSLAVWKPLFESDELSGYPHFHFSTTIYLDALEKKYLLYKKGLRVNWRSFFKEMNKFNIEEDDQTINQIVKALVEPMNIDHVRNGINSGEDNIDLYLNINFIRYMKERFYLPFILSDRYWNMLSSSAIFGHENELPECYFYISYTRLHEHFRHHYDKMFSANEIEMYGKVFGLYYVYYFLYDHQLIDKKYYELMIENINALRLEFGRAVGIDLWKMSFIFNWNHIYEHDPNSRAAFQATFSDNNHTYHKISDYLNSIFIPARLEDEIKAISTEQDSWRNTATGFDDADFFVPNTPIVKSGPVVGRNDPCPCGSGKKFKKCCLDMENG